LAANKYAKLPEASAAVFREALACSTTTARDRAGPGCPKVSIDPRFGFTLILLEGGAEIPARPGRIQQENWRDSDQSWSC